MCLSSPSTSTVYNPPTVTQVADQSAGRRASRDSLRRRQYWALTRENTASGGQLQGNIIDGVRKEKLGV